jgi:hypothetical protein
MIPSLQKTAPTLFLSLAALLATPACKKAAAPGPAGSAPTAPANAAADDADQAEGAKLSAAIECLNRHTANVWEIRDKYLETVDAKTGNSKGKKPVLMGMYGTVGCVRGVKEASAVKPAVPALDKASADYVAALESFAAIWDQVKGYYTQDGHLDDKGKKGEELHPKLMESIKTFAAANKELGGIVQSTNRARREAKVAAREKAEGRKLAVIMDLMMLEAETLVSMATDDAAESAKLDAQIAKTAKLVEEVDTYAAAHGEEANQFGSMANIKNYDKTFLAASKAVARKLRDKATPTDDEYSAVSKQYNSLVDNYNRH